MDFNRLTQKSQEAVHDAQTKALRFGHVEVDGEHLLLALVDQAEGLIPRLLARLDVPVDDCRAQRRSWSKSSASGAHACRGPGVEGGKIYVTQRLQPPLGAGRGRGQAPEGRVRVGGAPGAGPDRGGHRHRRPRAGSSPRYGVTARARSWTALEGGARPPAGHERHAGSGTYEALGDATAADLVKEAQARQGKLDPVIGRDAEIRRVIQDPVAQDQEQPGADRRTGGGQDGHRGGAGAADRAGRRPRGLKDKRIFALDMGALSPGPSTAASSRSG
ncbi:MAG: hypothetical protein KatS3mg131_1203 [Candidatus Tectimicrobiota bacterium]|nr:MAG: hypothetical protein KatS3mg131_1203 [Candidatus Tectomicrobia bacterium]